MKSYLFATDNDRGGVMLCDIDDFSEAVDYLCERFDGVVRIEAGEELWQKPDADPKAISSPVTEESDNQASVASGTASVPEDDLFSV